MSRSKFVPFLKSILPDLPGFAMKGRLLFMEPIGHMLLGISFEPFSFDDISFYLTKFVMPLCVPSSYIYFNFSGRMRAQTKGFIWRMDVPNLKEELIDVIRHVGAPFISSSPSWFRRSNTFVRQYAHVASDRLLPCTCWSNQSIDPNP